MAITTCVFDAYGTLFDVASAAREAAGRPENAEIAENWAKLAGDWRQKQLQYSWLRAVMGAHTDFWQVTQDGLDWAMEANGVSGVRVCEKTCWISIGVWRPMTKCRQCLRHSRRRASTRLFCPMVRQICWTVPLHLPGLQIGWMRCCRLNLSVFSSQTAESMTWLARISDVGLRRCFLSPPTVGMRQRQRNMAFRPLG